MIFEATHPTPRAEGMRMPGEFEPHECCVMVWPLQSRKFWGDLYPQVQREYAEVARSIAAFEPVLMAADPDGSADARNLCGSDIEVIEMPLNDSWTRDFGPNFLVGSDGRRGAADFVFNSWGEKYVPFDRDARFGARICKHLGMKRYAAPMVLEGGAITVDGEGTLMATETCVLNPNRNPGMSKQQAEEIFLEYLGVEKVIWLKGGLFGDWLDGHVDALAAFLRPGTVLLHTTSDESRHDFAYFAENRRRIEQAVDARGRRLEIVEFDPTPFVAGAGSRPSGHVNEVDAPAWLLSGEKSSPIIYVNFYLANGGVVVPGIGQPCDEMALARLGDTFPDREVVLVPVPAIEHGGGAVHCITQQVPAAQRGQLTKRCLESLPSTWLRTQSSERARLHGGDRIRMTGTMASRHLASDS